MKDISDIVWRIYQVYLIPTVDSVTIFLVNPLIRMNYSMFCKPHIIIPRFLIFHTIPSVFVALCQYIGDISLIDRVCILKVAILYYFTVQVVSRRFCLAVPLHPSKDVTSSILLWNALGYIQLVSFETPTLKVQDLSGLSYSYSTPH